MVHSHLYPGRPDRPWIQLSAVPHSCRYAHPLLTAPLIPDPGVDAADAAGWIKPPVSVGGQGTLRALGKCLDATGLGTANGTKIEVWDCNGGANQQWTALPVS